GFDPLSLPLAAPRLRRWRLCWRKAGDDPRRVGQWTLAIVMRPDQARAFCLLPLGSRANIGLAGPQPAAGKGLRGDDRQRRGLAVSGIGPALGAASCADQIPLIDRSAPNIHFMIPGQALEDRACAPTFFVKKRP